MSNSKETKSTSRSSLMNKTKAELVSIILRKDAVDKEKQAVIDELRKKAVTRVEYETLKESFLAENKKAKDFENNYDMLDLRNRELSKAIDKLQNQLTDEGSLVESYKSKYKFWRDFAIAFVLITIMVVVLKAIM